MPRITILSEADLRGAIKLDRDAVDCIENAFAALVRMDVVMPPILRLDLHENNGEVDVKTAYVPGLPSFAIKISPGFFDNPKRGLPSVNGLMVLLSAETGLVEALLLDNGYLTDIRTASAGAVAAKYLARRDARTAAVLGGGTQARMQLEALTLVRPLESARIWARRLTQAEESAATLTGTLGIPVAATASAEEAVRGADIVVTTTPATEPILQADWLESGQHVTAVGADAEHKNEIAPAALARADLVVCDRRSQCIALGELHHAIAAGIVPPARRFPEIGEIILEPRLGRVTSDQLTICDLTGTGVQDTAIAVLARERCLAAGAGVDFTS